MVHKSVHEAFIASLAFTAFKICDRNCASSGIAMFLAAMKPSKVGIICSTRALRDMRIHLEAAMPLSCIRRLGETDVDVIRLLVFSMRSC